MNQTVKQILTAFALVAIGINLAAESTAEFITKVAVVFGWSPEVKDLFEFITHRIGSLGGALAAMLNVPRIVIGWGRSLGFNIEESNQEMIDRAIKDALAAGATKDDIKTARKDAAHAAVAKITELAPPSPDNAGPLSDIRP